MIENEDLFDFSKDNLSIESAISPSITRSPSLSSSISITSLSLSSLPSLPSLFIAHDNPQLEKMITLTNNDVNLNTKIPIMLETKDKSGYICIILGDIQSTSTTEDVRIKYQSNSTITTPTTPDTIKQSRGDQCITCTNLVGYRFLLNNIKTRKQDKTIDIQLISSELVEYIRFDKNEQLNNFFSQCFSRVDIILSPFHENDWYPYWELPDNENNNNNNNDNNNNTNENKDLKEEINILTSGLRKLAPQFRSNGIGYLRLGNDMSNFGTDFLSIDGMNSFISNYHLLNNENSINQLDQQTNECDNLIDLINQLSESSKWIDRCKNLKKINSFLK